jgi:glycosyltransferase involved in cell wall biosynthesis
VIARYGDRVQPVLKDAGGQASALNAGWLRSRADVVIFLDADDELLPHAVASVGAAFAAAPAAAKVQYRMAVIDAAGRATGAIKPPVHVRLPNGDVRRAELTFPFDLPWLATSGNAFSRAALARLMPIPEAEFSTSADWYLRHLAALVGEVVSLDEVCARYRVHGANGYELADPELDLRHVRQTVRYAAATRRHLRRLACELDLPMPAGPILSASDLGNRLISRKLSPAEHPLPRDRVARLALAGATASVRRFDVPAAMKAVCVGWFAAMALAPRRPARGLATQFLFPERRGRLGPLLRRGGQR